MQPSLAYRPDIDGLRAVSVLAVVAFHAGLPPFSGGFVGVDVFFVISGFLITGLLLAEHRRQGRISLVDFWARRMRRLAPALLSVLVAVVASGALVLERISGEVGSLARAAVATVLLNSNHFFYLGAGDYFGAAAETNPLLHMWSLSVEEQFYLLWPVSLVLLLARLRSRGVGLAIALIGLVSFAISCRWTAEDVASGFYLMPSRAWELMAGALLALWASAGPLRLGPRAAAWLAGCGLLLIVGSCVAVPGGSRGFPGPLAALPVAGAVLFIAAGCGASTSRLSRVVGSRPMAYVGKISYPLYLWHWPALVFVRSTRLYEKSLWLELAAVAASAVLAVLTYEWIEKGAWRSARSLRSREMIAGGTVASAAVLALCLGVGAWARYGWGYTPQEQALDAVRKDMPRLGCMFSAGFPDRQAFEACFPAGRGATVLLWGDSHANHWREAFSAAAGELDVGLATLAMNGCRPLPHHATEERCAEFNETVIRNLSAWRRERGLAGIVLSARWPEGTGTLVPFRTERARAGNGRFYDARATSQEQVLSLFFDQLSSLVALAREQGLRVLIILPSPVQRFAAVHCLAIKTEEDCFVTLQEMADYAGPAERVIRTVARRHDNVRLFDPKSFMCDGGRCPVVLDGRVAYTDANHVTRSFSLAHVPRFVEALAWLVEGRRDGPS